LCTMNSIEDGEIGQVAGSKYGAGLT